jgi:hypothetical protein
MNGRGVRGLRLRVLFLARSGPHARAWKWGKDGAMPYVLKVIVGLAVIAVPFLLVMRLMRVTKRNEGRFHGGGIRRYWQIKSGRVDDD